MTSEKQIKRPELQGHFPCLSCAQIFGHAASLRRHREVAHNDEHFCLLCNTQLSGKETVKMHMRDKHDLISIYTCGCCNFTFPSRIEFSSHLKAMKKNEGRKDENIIARTIETPGVLRDGSGSVSPTNTSSSSESSTPSTAPVSPVAATVPGDTTAVQEKKEHPVRTVFEKLLNGKIEKMLDSGIYSNDQLVMVETWIEMIEKATESVEEDLKNES